MKLFRRKFYDQLSLDEFMTWSYNMFLIGFSVSTWRGDYGTATCENCRAIVDTGVPEMALSHAKQHRGICGDQNLPEVVRGKLSERLATIEDWNCEILR